MRLFGQALLEALLGLVAVILVTVLILGLLATCCRADTLPERVIAESGRYLHVREVGVNRGPEIDSWLRYLGLPVGLPYCAAYGVSMYHLAGHNLPRIGRCSLLWQRVTANGLRYQMISAEQVSLGAKLQPADFIIWRHGKGPGQNWNGHAGLLLTQKDKKTFRSREANTQPGPEGDQREGGGVYDRTRTLGLGSSFQVVGFFRVR
jgi:hypothetical protein